MAQVVIAGLFSIIALLAFYFAARTLSKFGWIVGFLRGISGLLLLGAAAVLALSAFDLLSYKQVLSEKPLLTISFEKLSEQSYKASVSFIAEGREEDFEIHGEQWQIDARVIRWKGIILGLGAKPGFRLDRISGRYYSLEDERRKERSVHDLSDSKYLDLWALVQENGAYFPLFDAVYGSATYLPMKGDAMFQVSIDGSGLVARPMNDIAEEAINQWQ